MVKYKRINDTNLKCIAQTHKMVILWLTLLYETYS